MFKDPGLGTDNGLGEGCIFLLWSHTKAVLPVCVSDVYCGGFISHDYLKNFLQYTMGFGFTPSQRGCMFYKVPSYCGKEGCFWIAGVPS